MSRTAAYYAAAYEDGDLRVVLYRSSDGVHWDAGALIYGVSRTRRSRPSWSSSPSGKRMLALVRIDGDDSELLGGRRPPAHEGLLVAAARTSASPARRRSTACGSTARWRSTGASRLFVVARKHLVGADLRKRTALYELRGNFEKRPAAHPRVG